MCSKQARPLGVPVMAGILLLTSVGMAHFMNKNVAGVRVPDALIAKMASTKDRAATSIEIAAHLIRAINEICQGVQIVPIGWEKRVPAVLEAAELSAVE